MAVVHLFGSETWVMTPRLEKALERFCHCEVRQMAGMGPKRQRDGTWIYTPIRAAPAMVVLEEIGLYTARFQNTAAQYIGTHNIMDLCLAVERKPGMCLSRRWW